MLVLARKVDQWLRIGNVTVKVVRIRGGQVRLGISAPADVPIYRGPEMVDEDGNLKPRSGTPDELSK